MFRVWRSVCRRPRRLLLQLQGEHQFRLHPLYLLLQMPFRGLITTAVSARKIKGSFTVNQRAASRLLHMSFRSVRKLKFWSCDVNVCRPPGCVRARVHVRSEMRCRPSLLSLSLFCTSPVCFPVLVFLNASRCVPWSHSIIYDPPARPPTVQY